MAVSRPEDHETRLQNELKTLARVRPPTMQSAQNIVCLSTDNVLPQLNWESRAEQHALSAGLERTNSPFRLAVRRRSMRATGILRDSESLTSTPDLSGVVAVDVLRVFDLIGRVSVGAQLMAERGLLGEVVLALGLGLGPFYEE